MTKNHRRQTSFKKNTNNKIKLTPQLAIRSKVHNETHGICRNAHIESEMSPLACPCFHLLNT